MHSDISGFFVKLSRLVNGATKQIERHHFKQYTIKLNWNESSLKPGDFYGFWVSKLLYGNLKSIAAQFRREKRGITAFDSLAVVITKCILCRQGVNPFTDQTIRYGYLGLSFDW